MVGSQRYDLKIEVDPEARTIVGTNEMTFVPTSLGKRLQIDLQAPLKIEWVKAGERELKLLERATRTSLNLRAILMSVLSVQLPLNTVGSQGWLRILLGAVAYRGRRIKTGPILLRRLARGLVRVFGGLTRIMDMTNQTRGCRFR